MRALGTSILATLGILSTAHAAPHNTSYLDWRTFHGHGVNLGGWLVQESTIDTAWWHKYSHGASDEWTLCANLGSQCGPVLEHRYATFITTKDIDDLAASGISILRIPTTYAAWINLPGSKLYSGNQQQHLHNISTYAITKHNMHIVLDIHSLPGGTNGLDIGEAVGHYNWFHNETALTHSLRAVDAVVHFIQHSGHPYAYTLEPINEPADVRNMSVFGTPAALSESGAAWLTKYFHAVVQRVRAADPRIPVMLQGSFKPETYWSGSFNASANIVFDLHHYYWQYPNATSVNLPGFICRDAKASKGDGKFPTFVGEWAIETGGNNSLALREKNVRVGLDAFGRFTRGSSYWTAKFWSNDTVAGEGVKGDYWNYKGFIEDGGLQGGVDKQDYCS